MAVRRDQADSVNKRRKMKTSKITLGLSILITFTVFNSYAHEFTLKTTGPNQFLHHFPAKPGSEGSYVGKTNLNSNPHADANTPGERVRGFYSWYLKSMLANSHFYSRSLTKTVLNSNFSKRFSRWFYSKKGREDSEDGDPFLMGNGGDEEGWANHVNVGKVTINGNTAVVKLTLGSPPDYIRKIKISLVKEAGTWKIDRIDD